MVTLTKIILFAVLAVAMGVTSAAWANPELAQEGESVIQHLKALRQEMKTLRQEVGQLRQAVEEIHRSSVPLPSSANPPPVSVGPVSLDGGVSLGSADAQVAIVEFTDFQCPFCQRYHSQTFTKLKETYIDSGKIRYTLRDFPLAFHTQAKSAAMAARCAGEQGKYWEMHHELFENQRQLGPEIYQGLAATLQLSANTFQTCLDSPVQEQAVEEDLAYGQSIGVRGTPNFFIGKIQNGQVVNVKRVSGAQPLPVFSKIIDSFLE